MLFFRNSLVQPRPVPPRANVLRTLRSDLHSVQTQVICVSKWHIGGCAGGLQRLERPDLGVIRGQHWYPLHTANRLPHIGASRVLRTDLGGAVSFVFLCVRMSIVFLHLCRTPPVTHGFASNRPTPLHLPPRLSSSPVVLKTFGY